MPIYEYRCSDCGHQLEAIQKFSDAPLVDCPECGKPALTKLISASAFQLKGTGWYVTDFRDKKKPAESGGADKAANDDKGKTGDGGAKASGTPASSDDKGKTGTQTADKTGGQAPNKTGSES